MTSFNVFKHSRHLHNCHLLRSPLETRKVRFENTLGFFHVIIVKALALSETVVKNTSSAKGSMTKSALLHNKIIDWKGLRNCNF